jgi:hypothetical protein
MKTCPAVNGGAMKNELEEQPSHNLKVEQTHNGPYLMFRGVCSCGWVGPSRNSSIPASADLGSHFADAQIEEMRADGSGAGHEE